MNIWIGVNLEPAADRLKARTFCPYFRMDAAYMSTIAKLFICLNGCEILSHNSRLPKSNKLHTYIHALKIKKMNKITAEASPSLDFILLINLNML